MEMRRFSNFVIFLLFSFLSSQSYSYEPAVVSASPLASRVGVEILHKGGSAADAAIATAFALTVVEPYNSGIGGGGFLLYYEASTQKFYFVDYREMSPLNIDFEYLKKHPKDLETGIHSVGIPGFVSGMDKIHGKFRKVSWPGIIEPSIKLAREGISIKGKLIEKLRAREEFLSQDLEFKTLFIDPWKKGKLKIVQKDLADTLEKIALGGAREFYQGFLTQQMVAYLQQEGGVHDLADFKSYQTFFRKPYQFEVGDHQIISSPLPSSGGRALNFLFGRAFVNEIHNHPFLSLDSFKLHLRGMEDYFRYREMSLGDISGNIISHTTHLSVIDGEGNMAAMTNSLNYPFGAGRVVPGTGIILNNELGDFSLNPKSANRVKPGKRPLSSMSPTIIMKKRKVNDTEELIPKYVIGTPGGRTIPINLFQTLYYHWTRGLNLGSAIRKPKLYYSPIGKKVIVENDFNKNIKEELGKKYKIQEKDSVGNIQALEIQNQKSTKVYSDHRGEGKGYQIIEKLP